MSDTNNNENNNNSNNEIKNIQNKGDENIKKTSSKNLSYLDDIIYTVLNNDYSVYDLTFKVILLGESGK